MNMYHERPLEQFIQKQTRQGYKKIEKGGWFIEEGNSQKIRRKIKLLILEKTDNLPDRLCLYFVSDELEKPMSFWFTNPVQIKRFIDELNELLHIMIERRRADVFR